MVELNAEPQYAELAVTVRPTSQPRQPQRGSMTAQTSTAAAIYADIDHTRRSARHYTQRWLNAL